MPRWGMVIDLKRCVGCNSCTVACMQENTTPRGVMFTKVLNQEIGKYPNVTRRYVPVICNHCEDAPCVKVCPTGATYQREDGIVMVDDDKCFGCGACAAACPYKNRTILENPEVFKRGLFGDGKLTPFEEQGYWRYQLGTAVKCTFCHERVERGLDPACVVACPAEARIFGDLDDPDSKVNRLIQARKGVQPLGEYNTNSKVYYIE